MLITCHDIFNTARAERAKYPLTSGQYKLDEAIKTIDRWRDLVATISDRVRTGGKFGADENLGPCMADEREDYLKALPALIAELIGKKILPAIAALEGDGVPRAKVQRLLRQAETDVQRLLAECEALRHRIQGGTNQKHRLMRQGLSDLYGLLSDARALAKLNPICASDHDPARTK